MPDGNAAAQRAHAFSSMILDSGYQPVVIGMRRSSDGAVRRGVTEGDVLLWEMRYPSSAGKWLKMTVSIREIRRCMEELGQENIHAVIAMDYFSCAFARLLRYCRSRDILFIGDAVDWFSRSQYAFPKNIIKDLDTAVRMRFLYPRMRRMIVISEYLKRQYASHVGQIAEIPGVVLPDREQTERLYHPNQLLTFSFVGAPGKKCEKEKIDWLIRILCKINAKKRRVVFHAAGVDEKTLLNNLPELGALPAFRETVVLHGRISHKECMELTAKSDFSVIIREDNRLSRAGFPTKLGEAFACGTPVLVTPAGNMADYIPEGYGFVAGACTCEALNETVEHMLELSREEIARMHRVVASHNPLDCTQFAPRMQMILERGEMVHADT